jgi:hypothetical protein
MKKTICWRPSIVLMTPAVDLLEKPVAGANEANSVAMDELVMVAG